MPAPKNNKYALGNSGGRPPMYKSAEEMELKINEYFDSCSEEVEVDENEKKNIRRSSEPFTITGLALFLGFESRQSLFDYEKNEEYTYIIKRARLVIENRYEQSLAGQSPTGSIFALKNMGWKDRQEIEHSEKKLGKDLADESYE
jgi:hypothetical protein